MVKKVYLMQLFQLIKYICVLAVRELLQMPYFVPIRISMKMFTIVLNGAFVFVPLTNACGMWLFAE